LSAFSDGDKGDITVTSSGATWTIDSGVVTFAKMQAVSADVLLGNDSSGTTVQEITCTAAGRAILDDADASAQRTTLGLAIGTNVQAWDADLDALAALSGTNTIYYRSGANTWSAVTIGSNLTFSGGTLAASGGGSGTVTSVGLSLPGIFSVTGSPVTTSGTLTASLATQTANIVWAGPTSGGAASPTFRSLVAADLPTVPIAQGGTNLTALGTANQVLGVNNGASGLEYKTITAGTNVTVTHGANSITIASTGGGGGTPAGSDTEVQFNSTGSFGANSDFIVDVGGTTTALVKIDSPSNTKPALRLQSNGASQTAPVLAVTDGVIDVCRVMRDGTINEATWGGNTIARSVGGTGITATGTANQLLGNNNANSALEYKTVTAGTGIVVSHSAGAITLSTSGSTLTGTTATGTLANNASVDVTHPSDVSFNRIPLFQIKVQTDPSIMLHFNGTNGSTAFTDSSPSAFSMTRTGTPTISTAQSQFGGASGLFNGTSDYISSPADQTALNLSSGDFTIEGWVRFSSLAARMTFFHIGKYAYLTNADLGIFSDILTDGTVTFGVVSGTTVTVSITGTTVLATNTWHHIAATRTGNTWRLFVNGTLDASAIAATTPNTPSGYRLHIGSIADVAPRYFNGYMDEFRVLKGTSLYTATFTPPATAFGDVAPWENVKLSNSLISDSDCVDVQYGNAIGGAQATTTRFTNRLGSTVTYRALVYTP
jgi:hypothetical protein